MSYLARNRLPCEPRVVPSDLSSGLTAAKRESRKNRDFRGRSAMSGFVYVAGGYMRRRFAVR